MPAQDGDKVKVHYTLKDAKGTVVESSLNKFPLEFSLGGGNMIPGFEKCLRGMEPGEKKTITIPPEEAYGLHDKKRVFEFDKKNAPGDFDPSIGQTIQMHRPDGKSITATVLSRTEKGFMMDANHPLAGKELTFDIELVEILK